MNYLFTPLFRASAQPVANTTSAQSVTIGASEQSTTNNRQHSLAPCRFFGVVVHAQLVQRFGGAALLAVWLLFLVGALAFTSLAVAQTQKPTTQKQARTATTDPASMQLRAFINQVQRAQGQFSQQTTSADGQAQPQQTGHFAFNREQGQFFWRVERPYEQLILADGQRLIQYDPDLSQATERGLEAALGSSPAAILFGSRRLDQAFDIEDVDEPEANQDLVWLRATPISGEAGFQYVDMGFKDSLPQQLLIADGFGQRTIIELQAIETAVDFPDDTFVFTAPEGVDYIRLD